MKKRLISIVFALSILSGLVPACAVEQLPEDSTVPAVTESAGETEQSAVSEPAENAEGSGKQAVQPEQAAEPKDQPAPADTEENPAASAQNASGSAQNTAPQVDTERIESDSGELRDVHFEEEEEPSLLDWGREAVLRRRLLKAWDAFETTVDVSDMNIKTSEIEEVFQNEYVTLLDANAKYFYVKASIDYTYNLSSGKILELQIQYKPEYCKSGKPDETRIVSLQKQLDTAIDRALECVSDDMSDIEVALALHDYLVRELDYDYENELNVSNGVLDDFPEEDCTAAGALINRKAVCQGYAQAYSNLLKRWGIESYIVTSRPMNHSWNLVCIDGKWYHVDVAWDDPVWENYATGGYTQYYGGNNDALDEGYVQHTYFLKGDSEMQELSHYGWTGKLPKAEQTTSFSGYCFYERNCALYWRDGYWYFSPEGREIYRAKINQRGTVVRSPSHRTRYTHGYSSNLYCTDGENIYRIAIDGGQEEIALTAPNDHIITEFAIKQKRLVYVLWDTGTDQYSRHTAELAATEEQSRISGVKLDQTEVTVQYGTTVTLTPTILPSAPSNTVIRWRTSNRNVATVKDGVITPVGSGKAIITVVAGGKTAECTVTVKVPKTKSITLAEKAITLETGKTRQLKPEVVVSGSGRSILKWSSSNPSVATVDQNGLVTAKKVGSAVITVNSGDKNAACTVNVKAPLPAKTSFQAVSAGYHSVKFTWSKAKGAKTYRIYRRENGNWVRIASVASDKTTYTVSGLTCGTNYTFTVRAFNDSGGGEYNRSGVTVKPIPSTPVLQSATAGSKKVTVKWSKVAGAQGYRVYRKSGSGSWERIKTVGPDTTQYTDTGLKKGTKYTYTVRAYRKNGSTVVLSGYDKTGKSATAK